MLRSCLLTAICMLPTIWSPVGSAADLEEIRQGIVSLRVRHVPQEPAKTSTLWFRTNGGGDAQTPGAFWRPNATAPAPNHPAQPTPGVRQPVYSGGMAIGKSGMLDVRNGKRIISATGFRFGEDGRIMTVLDNDVRSTADTFFVRFDGGTREATLVAWDAGNGLAVLEQKADDTKTAGDDPTKTQTSLTLAESDVEWGAELRTVFEIRKSVPKVAVGIATTPSYYFASLGGNIFETDIEIEAGSTGAPVLNADDHVVGIMKAMRSADGTGGPGIAISRGDIQRLVDFVEKGSSGALPKPLLGVALAPTSSTTDPGIREMITGALISKVLEGSSAEKAGVKQGDIITLVDGVQIKRFEDVIGIVNQHAPGDVVPFEFSRNGSPLRYHLELKERSPSMSADGAMPKIAVSDLDKLGENALLLLAPGLGFREGLTDEQKKTLDESMLNIQARMRELQSNPGVRVLAVPPDVNSKLDALSQRIDTLTENVEKLTEALK